MPEALRINHNISAINTRRRMSANNSQVAKHMERLSSGLRVNRASDDAAGLVVREGMRAEIGGLKTNIRNAEQGVNLLQVAEGTLGEVNAMLIRMRELKAQSASSNINDMNRQGLQAEYTQIIQEIDRVAFLVLYNDQVLLTGFGNVVSADASTALTNSNTTGVTAINISGAQHGEYTFEDGGPENTITLGNGTVTQTIRLGQMLDGDVVATGSTMVANFDRLGIQLTLAGTNVTNATGNYEHGELDDMSIVIDQGTGGSFQVGPDDGATQRIEVGMPDMRASGAILNLNASSISSMYSARTAIAQVDQAIDYVANQRGDLCAFMNRMQYTISWIENEIENMQNSEDSISSADIAEEITALTRSQILTQAATSMLTQSNAQTANALSLLQ